MSALVRKRAELAGDTESTHAQLGTMLADLENLDATLKMFDPSYQVEAIKLKAFRPPEDWSNQGEMTHIILSILRQVAEPLKTRDIAPELLVKQSPWTRRTSGYHGS